MRADQEVGDETCAICRPATALRTPQVACQLGAFGGKGIEAQAERPERVATVLVAGEMRAHLGPHDVTCHKRPGSICRPQRVAGRLAEGGIGPSTSRRTEVSTAVFMDGVCEDFASRFAIGRVPRMASTSWSTGPASLSRP